MSKVKSWHEFVKQNWILILLFLIFLVVENVVDMLASIESVLLVDIHWDRWEVLLLFNTPLFVLTVGRLAIQNS